MKKKYVVRIWRRDFLYSASSAYNPVVEIRFRFWIFAFLYLRYKLFYFEWIKEFDLFELLDFGIYKLSDE